jgi:ribonucleoside-diphosphate reductase alpha chain
VPLETLVQKFSYMRFEPEGITQNPEIPFAKSLPDYIMRWLASRFLDVDAQEELGILTPEVRARKAAQEAAQSLVSSDTSRPGADLEPEDEPLTHGGNGSSHAPKASNGGSSASSAPHGGSPATPSASHGGSSAPAAASFTDSPPVVPARLHGFDLGPACGQCGGMMQRTGSCYTCSSCGNNTGCG